MGRGGAYSVHIGPGFATTKSFRPEQPRKHGTVAYGEKKIASLQQRLGGSRVGYKIGVRWAGVSDTGGCSGATLDCLGCSVASAVGVSTIHGRKHQRNPPKKMGTINLQGPKRRRGLLARTLRPKLHFFVMIIPKML